MARSRLLLLLLCCGSAAAGPAFLVAAPWSIRPGANVTVAVAVLPGSPAPVTVRGEVIRDNETILSGEAVFEKDCLIRCANICADRTKMDAELGIGCWE